MECICVICNTPFNTKRCVGKYCSAKCRREGSKKDRPCLWCGTVFKTNKKTARYCSMMCSSLHQRKRVELTCSNQYCDNKYYVRKSELDYGYGKYCSKKCHNDAMKQPYWLFCMNCGMLVEVFNVSGAYKRKFCSDECKSLYYRHEIDVESTIKMYVEDGTSVPSIAEQLDLPHQYISKVLRENNIEIRNTGFGNKFECSDGHVVRSQYEKVFDERLIHYGIEHLYEPRISKEARFFADFKVEDVFIEIWGMVGWERYDKRKGVKTDFYKKLGLPLFEIYPEDFRDIDKKIIELMELLEKRKLSKA